MNFTLLALAIIPGIWALIALIRFVRVALGQLQFNSGFATFMHFVYLAGGAPLSAWLFTLALS